MSECVQCGRETTTASEARCDLCRLREYLEYRVNGLRSDADRAMRENFEPGFHRANAMAEAFSEILHEANSRHEYWMRQLEKRKAQVERV